MTAETLSEYVQFGFFLLTGKVVGGHWWNR